MSKKATKVVDSLLEEEDDIDPGELVASMGERAAALRDSGVLTQSSVLNDRGFYHRTMKYKGRDEPLYARRNGATKTWKRQPGVFKIPMKYGMYEHFYITNANAHEWSTIPKPTQEVGPEFYGPPPQDEFFDT